jgi:hypothetical protein
MKIKAYTTIKRSVGNVIPGTTEIIEAQTMEDKGSYYSVVIHENRERRYSKKYWKVEAI